MKKLSFSLLLTVLVISPSGMNAAFLSLTDTNANDTILVSANDFEFGLSINGVPFQQGLGNPASGTFPETNSLTFSGQWLDQGATTPGAHTIYLVEAFDPTLISDILQYTLDTSGGHGFINGSFISDNENNLGRLPPALPPGSTVFVENGQAVDFSAPFLTALVLSDTEVPEPGAASILLLGLLGACGVKYARRVNTAK